MELQETTPLLATASISRSQYAHNVHLCFDKIWIGCLALILIVGFCTGIYLLIEEDLQKKHKGTLGVSDILYNFLVGGDGRVYEGRGWQNKTEWQNPDEHILSIALLGNFENEPPKPAQIEALLAFLDLSVMKNRITPCVNILVDHTENRYFLDTAFQLEGFIRNQNKC